MGIAKHPSVIATRTIAASILMAIGSTTAVARAAEFTTIDVPNGGLTRPQGISGDLVVGGDTNGDGFIYNLKTNSFNLIHDPLGDTTGRYSAYNTNLTGISGNTVVGSYLDQQGIGHGFEFDGSTYTTIDDPSANKTVTYQGTWPDGIYNGTIFGHYNVPLGFGSFLYSGGTFSDLTYPDAPYGTFVAGMSGNMIVGWYESSLTIQGFLYDGANFSTFADPFAAAAPLGQGQTIVTGISGPYIVGYYSTDAGYTHHGFIYDGSTFTTTDDPLSNGDTRILGVSGNTIIGTYQTDNGYHGFVATIPEPSSSALLLVGGLGLVYLAIRRQSTRRMAAAEIQKVPLTKRFGGL